MDSQKTDDSNDDGLTDEERAWYEAQEPGPSLLDGYIHPITGEVMIEPGPNTPETRAAKAEIEQWCAQQRVERDARIAAKKGLAPASVEKFEAKTPAQQEEEQELLDRIFASEPLIGWTPSRRPRPRWKRIWPLMPAMTT